VNSFILAMLWFSIMLPSVYAQGPEAKIMLPMIAIPATEMVKPVLTTSGGHIFYFSQRFVVGVGGSLTAKALKEVVGGIVMRSVLATESVMGSFRSTMVVLCSSEDLERSGYTDWLEGMGKDGATGKIFWEEATGVCYLVISSFELISPLVFSELLAHSALGPVLGGRHIVPSIIAKGIAAVVAGVVVGLEETRMQRVHEHPLRDRFLSCSALATASGAMSVSLADAQQAAVEYAMSHLHNAHPGAIATFLTQCEKRISLPWKDCLTLIDQAAGTSFVEQYGCFRTPEAGVWILPSILSPVSRYDLLVVARTSDGRMPATSVVISDFCRERTMTLKANEFVRISHESRLKGCPKSAGLNVRSIIKDVEYGDVLILGDIPDDE